MQQTPTIEGAEPVLQGLWALVPWLVLALTVATVFAAWALWAILSRLSLQHQRLAKLDRLDDIKVGLKELADSRGDLDLRRLEHVLIDIRDGQRRVEDALLRVVEATNSRASNEPTDTLVPVRRVPLEERVVNRLLSLGYERVKVVGSIDSEAVSAEVPVEARRDGVMHKGRVLLRDGVLTEVHLEPAYGAFP